MKRRDFLKGAGAGILGVMAAGRLGRGQGILKDGDRVTMLLEAEAFANHGGWKVDQQFMDQMGSPFLLAHGLGRPVEDATQEVRFPRGGEYRVWVRTRNWVAPWNVDGAPGKFRLLVNGRPVDTVFGTEGDEWHWQDGGTVRVDKGRATVALRDLTGFDGRCDAIVFTTDKGFRPPHGGPRLDAFRREALGLPDTPPSAGDYDFVVVGGGIAGTAAAIVASRLGVKTALIQDRPVLGGNNSSEIRVHALGGVNKHPYKALGDVVKEIAATHCGNAEEAEKYHDERILKAARAEDNLDLYLNMRVVDVEKDGNRISAVTGKHTHKNTEKRFEAPLFADCTGDGNVGYMAGAEYRMGREGENQTGESMAPEKPDEMTMGCSVLWNSRKEPGAPDFPDCPWGVQFDENTAWKTFKADWKWEAGYWRNMITEFEYVRDYLLRAVYSNWAFLKNEHENKQKWADRELNWVAYVAGKRESRRLLGDVILDQLDIDNAKKYPDACVTATWGIDLHHPHPKYKKAFGESFIAANRHPHHKPYPIPYRCLYSRNVDNLLLAGRDISVTHVALGTVRVMRTTGMMGEVIGMASRVCTQAGIPPRGVYKSRLDQLKELMKEGAGLKNG